MLVKLGTSDLAHRLTTVTTGVTGRHEGLPRKISEDWWHEISTE